MESEYKIYKYTNLINGKIYIGQTKNSLAKRADNGRGYKKCPAFNNAIQKYGFENFNVEILKDNLTLQEANEWEKYYIRHYDSTNKEKGYNIKIGGNNCAEAAKELNLNANSIARVCSGIRKSLYKLHFEYIYEEVK